MARDLDTYKQLGEFFQNLDVPGPSGMGDQPAGGKIIETGYDAPQDIATPQGEYAGAFESGDFIDALQQGTLRDIVGGIPGGLAQIIGAGVSKGHTPAGLPVIGALGLLPEEQRQQVGGAISEVGKAWSDVWEIAGENVTEDMTPEGKKALSRPFIEGDEALFGGKGEHDIDAWILKVAQAVPSIAASFLPGLAAARAGAGVKTVAGIAGVSEGVMGASFAANEISNTIDDMSLEDLQTNFPETYQTAMAVTGTNPEAAKQAIKDKVRDTAILKGSAIAATLTTTLGAGGGALLPKIIPVKGSDILPEGLVPGAPKILTESRLGRGVQGGVLGGIQEGAQEAGEQFGVNVGVQAPDLTAGLGEAAVAGTLTGGPIEGAMSAIPGGPISPDEKALVDVEPQVQALIEAPLDAPPVVTTSEVAANRAVEALDAQLNVDGRTYEVEQVQEGGEFFVTVAPVIKQQGIPTTEPVQEQSTSKELIRTGPQMRANIKDPETAKPITTTDRGAAEQILAEQKAAIVGEKKKPKFDVTMTEADGEYTIQISPVKKAEKVKAEKEAKPKKPTKAVEEPKAVEATVEQEPVLEVPEETEAEMPQPEVAEEFETDEYIQETRRDLAATLSKKKGIAPEVQATIDRIATAETVTDEDIQELAPALTGDQRKFLKRKMKSENPVERAAAVSALRKIVAPSKYKDEVKVKGEGTRWKMKPYEEIYEAELEQFDEQGHIPTRERKEAVDAINKDTPLGKIVGSTRMWQENLDRAVKRAKKGDKTTARKDVQESYMGALKEAYKYIAENSTDPERIGLTQDVYDAVATVIDEVKRQTAFNPSGKQVDFAREKMKLIADALETGNIKRLKAEVARIKKEEDALKKEKVEKIVAERQERKGTKSSEPVSRDQELWGKFTSREVYDEFNKQNDVESLQGDTVLNGKLWKDRMEALSSLPLNEAVGQIIQERKTAKRIIESRASRISDDALVDMIADEAENQTEEMVELLDFLVEEGPELGYQWKISKAQEIRVRKRLLAGELAPQKDKAKVLKLKKGPVKPTPKKSEPTPEQDLATFERELALAAEAGNDITAAVEAAREYLELDDLGTEFKQRLAEILVDYGVGPDQVVSAQEAQAKAMFDPENVTGQIEFDKAGNREAVKQREADELERMEEDTSFADRDAVIREHDDAKRLKRERFDEAKRLRAEGKSKEAQKVSNKATSGYDSDVSKIVAKYSQNFKNARASYDALTREATNVFEASVKALKVEKRQKIESGDLSKKEADFWYETQLSTLRETRELSKKEAGDLKVATESNIDDIYGLEPVIDDDMLGTETFDYADLQEADQLSQFEEIDPWDSYTTDDIYNSMLEENQKAAEMFYAHPTSTQRGWVQDIAKALMPQTTEDTTTSVDQALGQIVKNSPKGHPVNILAGNLRRHLRRTGATLPDIRLTTMERGTSGQVRLGRGAQGTGIADIALNRELDPTNESEASAITIAALHEIIHAVTLTELATDSKFAAEMTELFESWKAEGISAEGTYGITTIAEFVAEAFSNPVFQAELASAKAPKTAKSYWQSFIDSVKKYLGIQAVPNSYLEAVVGLAVPKMGGRPITGDVVTEVFRSERVPLADAAKKAVGELFQDLSKSEGGTRVTRNFGKTALHVMQFEGIHREFRKWFQKGNTNLMDRFAKLLRDKEGIVGDLQEAGEKVLVEMRTFADKHDLGKFNDVATQATLDGLDPTIDFDEGTNKRWAEHTDEAVVEAKHKKHAELRKGMQATGDFAAASKLFIDVVNLYKYYFYESQLYITKRALEANAEQFGLVNAEGLYSTKMIEDLARKITDASQTAKGGDLLSDADARKAAIDSTLQQHLEENAENIENYSPAVFDDMLATLQKVLRPPAPGPYIPLRRRGDLVVVAKSDFEKKFASKAKAQEFVRRIENSVPGQKRPDGKEVRPHSHAKLVGGLDEDGLYTVEVREMVYEQHESFADWEAAGERLKAEFGAENVDTELSVEKALEKVNNLQGTAAFAERLKSDATKKVENATVINKTIDNALAQLVAERADRAAQMHRVGWEGASADLQHTLADSINAQSWAIADIRTASDIAQTLKEMEEHARGSTVEGKKGYGIMKSEVVNHLIKREAHSLTQDRLNTWRSELENRLTSTGFYWFLGSPSYSLVNLSQSFLVGLPYLSAKYGEGKAMKKFMGEWTNAMNVARGEFARTQAGFGDMPNQYIHDYLGVPEGETYRDYLGEKSKRGALAQIVQWRLVDATAIQELERAKAGFKDPTSVGARAYRAVGGKGIDAVMNAMRSMPQLVEQVNRMTMAAATYDLEVEKGSTHEQAMEAARQAIVNTQFNYSAMNRPQWMRDFPGGKALFLFKMYGVGMYSLLTRNAWAGFAAKTAAERMEARKMLGYLMAGHAVMGGAMGGLFVEPIKALVSLAAWLGGDDDDLDWETALTQGVYDQARSLGYEHELSKSIANVVMYGAPTELGLGDWHGRVGLNNLMYLPRTNYSGTGREWATNLFITAVGPLAAAFVNAADSTDHFKQGNIQKGLEGFMPKGLRDISKSQRLFTEGQKTRSSRQYVEPISVPEAVLQTVGFTPSDVARTYRERQAQIGYEKKLGEYRSSLIAQWRNAESQRERTKIWKEKILPFNRKVNYDKTLRIDMGRNLYKGLRDIRKDEEKFKRGEYVKSREVLKQLPYTQ